jgi:predicted acylesterase/phospholipase RssA
MEKEWANKDKYHRSNGVLEPHVQMTMAKETVRTVPAWGERKVADGAASRSTPVRPVHHTGQTGVGLGRQCSGFRAHEEAGFGSGGRGSGGWCADGQFARRSPPRAQYEGGRSRSSKMERRNGPRSSFRG